MANHTLRDLLAQIEAHGGPQGLNLEGANLARLHAGAEAIQAELSRLRTAQPEASPAWLSTRTGGLNLAGAILKRADLSDADLRRADLVGADLEGAALSDAHLQAANLQQARLADADLSDADLADANLAEATLDHAALDDATLCHANLQAAHLARAHLADADLRGANLAQADLAEAVLDDADLRQANLAGASLHSASLKDADLRQANLQGARLEEAVMEDADLRHANLAGASLRAARLRDADLRQATLDGADLTGAGVEGARLDGRRTRRSHVHGGDWGTFADRICSEVMAEVSEWVSPARVAAISDEVCRGLEQGLGEWAMPGEEPGEQPAGEHTSWSIPREGATALCLSISRGTIRVVGEARDDILLRCSPEAREDLEMARSEGAIHIRQRVQRGIGPHRLDLELALPRAIERLDLRTGLGSILGRDLTARVHLAAGKGDIRFEESRLEGHVHTGYGNVALSRVRGSIVVRAGKGDVLVQSAEQAALAVSTGRGNIRVEGGQLQEARLHTGLGDVRSACAFAAGVCRVNTGAGVITLELAEAQAAQVEASTGMGQVVSDWPLVRVGRPGPVSMGSMRMVGSIGNQPVRATLVLKTGMGNIYLKRAAARQAAPGADHRASPAGPPQAAAEPAPPAEPVRPIEPASPVDPPPAITTTEEARLAILQSLARGEINAEEAEELLNGLIG